MTSFWMSRQAGEPERALVSPPPTQSTGSPMDTSMNTLKALGSGGTLEFSRTWVQISVLPKTMAGPAEPSPCPLQPVKLE